MTIFSRFYFFTNHLLPMDDWILAIDILTDVPPFPTDVPLSATEHIRKRRRVGNDSAATSGNDSTATSGNDSNCNDTNGNDTNGNDKRKVRNRREQQRSSRISTQLVDLGVIIRNANVVPLPDRKLKKTEVLSSAIDTILELQARIQQQRERVPVVVCG